MLRLKLEHHDRNRGTDGALMPLIHLTEKTVTLDLCRMGKVCVFLFVSVCLVCVCVCVVMDGWTGNSNSGGSI